LNLHVLVDDACSLKVCLRPSQFAASVGKALSQRTLIPGHSAQEVRKCVFDCVGNAWFTLPVEEKAAIGNLALALQTEKHGMPEVRFEAVMQGPHGRFVFVLLDPDSSSELLSDRPDISIRVEPLEWDGREISPKLQHRKLSRSGASLRSGPSNECLPVRQLNNDGVPPDAVGDWSDCHREGATSEAEVHDVQESALTGGRDSRNDV